MFASVFKVVFTGIFLICIHMKMFKVKVFRYMWIVHMRGNNNFPKRKEKKGRLPEARMYVGYLGLLKLPLMWFKRWCGGEKDERRMKREMCASVEFFQSVSYDKILILSLYLLVLKLQSTACRMWTGRKTWCVAGMVNCVFSFGERMRVTMPQCFSRTVDFLLCNMDSLPDMRRGKTWKNER